MDPALHRILVYLGVNSGRMERGVMRFEASVSVRPMGSVELNPRHEIKNLNSFRFVERAINFEIERQIDVIDAQESIKSQVQEATELFNRSIDHMREQDDRSLIDYYAQDLADMAVHVLTSWLVLRDARSADRKRELAQVYVSETLPQFRGRMAVIQAIDPTPVQARESILSEA